ncbi:MAG TPA: S8 family serine peptidase [Woeseiaceae bacterium]|nr:S8 family serine peptidase [Woeseiaceae bacterium]
MNKSISFLLAGVFCLVSLQGFAQEPPELTLAQPFTLPAKSQSRVYIVQMAGDPVIAYDGGIRGLPATRPAPGRKINPNSAAVRKYVAHLDSRHDAVINALGAGDKVYDYRYAMNGFAAVMTESQAAAARRRNDVVQVWADEMLHPQTDSTPAYLGLSTPGGVWEQHGKGEGVIIGMIDTGVWPEHPSFSDQLDFSDAPGSSGNGNLAYGPPPEDWHGTCQSGERWSQDDCNNKVIGARWFVDGFSIGSSGILTTEFLSARDSDGHGSHTAGIAAGNEGVLNGINGLPVSGMAPRARIAVYKVCWDIPGDAGCASSDSAAAIDAAIRDGVDVINFSIGGPSTVFAGPDDVMFLFAAQAGVWVSVSNGNDGPLAQTTGTPAGVPWVTSVGASQDNEVFAPNLLVSGDLTGSFFAYEGAGDVPFSSDISGELVPADPLDACGPLTNAINGEIALVIRGTCAFTDKYNNAAAAGASAIIVYNDGTAPDRFFPITMSAPGTTIPGAMIGFDNGDLVHSTIVNGGSVTGVIGPGTFVSQNNRIADFSSRGPNGGAPDIIKPDVAAPGVAIISGETPEPNAQADGGSLWQSISGTSMASPHVAGVFALLKQAHPDWTPAMAKSALMTSARQDLQKTFTDAPADPFDIGAGHIVPGAAFNPGLVYDAGFNDYLAFTCDNNIQLVTDATCEALVALGFPTDGSELNLASIAIAEIVGTETVTRHVTSVTPGTTTFTASHVAPPGFDVQVTPAVLVLDEGETASFDVTVSATGSETAGEWAFGSLTWDNDAGATPARSPLAVRPVRLVAPAEASGTGTSGTLDFNIRFGYAGSYTATASGLVPAIREAATVVDDPGNTFEFLGPGTTLHLADVPAGTEIARWALFNEFTDGNDDLDLYVFHCPGGSCTLVDQSANAESDETVTLQAPAPGLYAIFVHGWETDGPDANYTLFHWASGAAAGNMTVSGPLSATLGATETITADWSGLDAGEKYLGAVLHGDGSSTIGRTVISVSTE